MRLVNALTRRIYGVDATPYSQALRAESTGSRRPRIPRRYAPNLRGRCDPVFLGATRRIYGVDATPADRLAARALDYSKCSAAIASATYCTLSGVRPATFIRLSDIM